MDNKFRTWFAATYPDASPQVKAIAWDAYQEGYARAVEAVHTNEPKIRPGMERPTRDNES